MTDVCDWTEEHPWDPTAPHITVRESTEAEREHAGYFPYNRAPMTAQRYVVCRYEDPTKLLGVFGMIDGGETREEAVFWAERMASKNGFHFLRPAGWEDVVGALPETDEE